MIKTTILFLCLCSSTLTASLVVPISNSASDQEFVYQLDAKSYLDIQSDLLNKDLEIYTLKAEKEVLVNKVKIEKEASIWAFYITLGLGIWGYSTCAPYGIVTGSIFLFNSYNNLKEVSK